MKCILFLKEAISFNIFRCNYHRNEKYFLNFFLDFVNLDSVLDIFKKKITVVADVFWTYGLRETWLDKCLKSPLSEHRSSSNMVNGPKHCWNINDRSFIIFIYPCENNLDGKSLS